MFKNKLFLTASMLCAAVVTTNAAGAASLSVSPASGPQIVGSTFDLQINLNTGGQPISAVDVFSLRYNPNLLQVVDANTGRSGVQITGGSLFAIEAFNLVDTAAGKIMFAQTAPAGGGSAFNGTGTLATVRFQVLAAGTAAVTFDFTAGSLTDCNVTTGTSDLLTSVTNGSLTLSTGPSNPNDSDGDGTVNASDCAQNDASKWRNGSFFRDADQDSYTTGSAVTVCYGAATPAGYRTAASGTDCNDSSGSVWRTGNAFRDADGDTYTSGAAQSICYGTSLPAGYQAAAKGSDCNDSDSSKFQFGNFFADSDSDGITSGGTISVCYGSSTPGGYRVSANGQDNCPGIANPDQLDSDGNGVGDLCESGGLDSDKDGLSDADEPNYGTDPRIADTDGDSVKDGQEVADGSDPLDSGSFIADLSTRNCLEWNGFLGMFNILEYVNLTSSPIGVNTEMFSIQGESANHLNFNVSGGGQYDLLVHDLYGRQANSYGQVCLESSGAAGDHDGRMVNYRPGANGRFEFAFALPMSNGLTRSQFVTFNTYQPSLAGTDQGNLVANWLQVTNVGAKEASADLIFRNQAGQTLETEKIILPAGARRDYSAHKFGSSIVGVVELRPEASDSTLVLRNVRYLYDNQWGSNTFATAFQLEGTKGSGRVLSIPLDTTGGSSAIIEVANTLNEQISATVDVYNQDGSLKRSQPLNLAPYASVHIITDGFLPNSLGTAVIRGSKRGSVIAVAMEYRRNSQAGIEYMYGVQGKEALGTVVRGSYNTYLEQISRIVLVNPTGAARKVNLTLTRGNGELVLGGFEIAVPAHGMKTYDVNQADNKAGYGVVTISPDQPNSIAAQVIRYRGLEYAIPTPVR